MNREARVIKFAIALTACAAIAAPASAESAPDLACNGKLRVLGEPQINELGPRVRDNVAVFREAIQSAKPTSPRATVPLVIDCLYRGQYPMRAVKLAPTAAMPSMRAMNPLYGIYVTEGLLFDLDIAKIRELANISMCIIDKGGAEGEGLLSTEQEKSVLEACGLASSHDAYEKPLGGSARLGQDPKVLDDLATARAGGCDRASSERSGKNTARTFRD